MEWSDFYINSFSGKKIHTPFANRTNRKQTNYLNVLSVMPVMVSPSSHMLYKGLQNYGVVSLYVICYKCLKKLSYCQSISLTAELAVSENFPTLAASLPHPTLSLQWGLSQVYPGSWKQWLHSRALRWESCVRYNPTARMSLAFWCMAQLHLKLFYMFTAVLDLEDNVQRVW